MNLVVQDKVSIFHESLPKAGYVNNIQDQKISNVVINALEESVITIYSNKIAQLTDFFKVSTVASNTQLTYLPILSSMDRGSPFIHISKGKGYIQSQKIDDHSFSLQSYFQGLVGRQVVVMDKEGSLIQGRILEFGSNTVTLYDNAAPPHKIRVIKREEIRDIQCDDLESLLDIEPSIKATYLNDSISENLEGQVISLNRGLQWNAFYRLILKQTDEGLKGKLISDAQILNTNNKELKNVVVKVVSGNLNFNMPEPLPKQCFTEMRAMACSNNANPQIAAIDQKWQDLKAYLIPYKMNLLPNETVSTRLFDPKDVEVKKTYVTHSNEYDQGEKNPHVCYLIENDKNGDLAQAFPEGSVHIFRQEGSQIDIIGNSYLNQTQNGKDLEIVSSKSFDLLSKRSFETKNIKNSKNETIAQEITVKLELSNGSDEDKTILIHEHLKQGVKILETSQSLKEISGDEIVYEVDVSKSNNAKNPIIITYCYKKDLV